MNKIQDTVFKNPLSSQEPNKNGHLSSANGEEPIFKSYREQLRTEFKKAIEEAYKESLKEISKEEEISKQKFKSLVQKSKKTLLRIKTVFPFDLFPDDITIETNQVNVCIRQFFLTQFTQSISIKNIQDVEVQNGPLFASMTLTENGAVPRVLSVSYLKKDDANKARRIIQGLVVASQEGIDFTKMPYDDIITQAEELGTARSLE
jgi:hypothetical protein